MGDNEGRTGDGLATATRTGVSRVGVDTETTVETGVAKLASKLGRAISAPIPTA
jgi:hypothetical protein